MPASGRSRADENRRIRQEALREQLSNQGHVQHVIDLVRKVEALADQEEGEPSAARIGAYRTAIDGRMKLINKFLPDLKASEIDMSLSDRRSIDEYSAAELAAIASGGAAGDSEAD